MNKALKMNLTEKIYFAANPKAPKYILEEFSLDKSEELRATVAENLNTPKKVLYKLALDTDLSVVFEVARNTSTAPDTLEKMLPNNDKIKMYVDDTLNIKEAREMLGYNCRLEDRIAANVNAPVKILEKLSESKSWVTRAEVAKNPNTPIEILKKLSYDFHIQPIIGVANNYNTPEYILKELLKFDDEEISREVSKCVLKNPGFSLNYLNQYLSFKVKFKYPAVENPNVSEKMLEFIVKNKCEDDVDIIYSVLKNPNVTKEILEYIYNNHDINYLMAEGIVRHPKVPENILYKALNLGNEERFHMYSEAMIRNENLPSAILEKIGIKILNEYDPGNKLANNKLAKCMDIAEHKKATKNILMKLAVDEELDIRNAVLKNPNLDEEIMEAVMNTNRLHNYII